MGKLNLTPQQIRSIKQSPKGKLPPFISAGVTTKGPIYSVGAKVGPVGGAVGVDTRGSMKVRPFGSVNIKGKVKAKFGPQE